jgi:PH/SEC7 domain-containing protein
MGLIGIAVSPLPAQTSHHDLTVGDLTLTRFSSRQSLAGAEETPDMDARGKELASRCWAEDEGFLAKEKISEWLGGQYVMFPRSYAHIS